MSNTTHAFDFLADEKSTAFADSERPSFLVVFGNEPFLKGRVRTKLQTLFLGGPPDGQETDGDDDGDINLIKLPGSEVQLNDLQDELDTISLFGGGPRVVYVEDADPFVSEHRAELESLVASGRSQGILILEVSDWRSNTKLYKAVDKAGFQIDCRLPSRGRSVDVKKIAKWGSNWGKKQHQLKIKPLVVEHMMDLVGPELGILDQNLAKLSLFFGPKDEVNEEAINEYVGGWQTKTVWNLIENAMNGHANSAISQLDRLLQNGEAPIALFGQISWSLRRYAFAFDEAQRYSRYGKRMDVQEVMTSAGFKFPPEQKKAIEHLKKIGREKGADFYQLLLQCDLALKASHSSASRSRIAVEKLIFELAGVG